MYVVKNEGSWVLFTKSNYLLNRALLNRGLGVYIKFLRLSKIWKESTKMNTYYVWVRFEKKIQKWITTQYLELQNKCT